MTEMPFDNHSYFLFMQESRGKKVVNITSKRKICKASYFALPPEARLRYEIVTKREEERGLY